MRWVSAPSAFMKFRRMFQEQSEGIWLLERKGGELLLKLSATECRGSLPGSVTAVYDALNSAGSLFDSGIGEANVKILQASKDEFTAEPLGHAATEKWVRNK